MGRCFNTEGICKPDRHYMVRLDERVRQMKERYVDEGYYFIINRGRQYGKTTTLRALTVHLQKEYTVLFMDFQMMSSNVFVSEHRFAEKFAGNLVRGLEGVNEGVNKAILSELQEAASGEQFDLPELFLFISRICSESAKKIVLLIDEVDSASNNQVFLDFLAQLRGYYLSRDEYSTFHSVILAGVYDIRNLKLKIRSDSEHQYNSPWNIAAKFDIDMNFSAGQIASMLREYEADKDTGMDVREIADVIYGYTSGYPYLVSAICKLVDEKVQAQGEAQGEGSAWTQEGINKAVQLLLKENSPLFDSLSKQLDAYGELQDIIEDILYRGQRVVFSLQLPAINLGVMFGYLKEENGAVAIANRIFEIVLLNMFIAREALENRSYQYGSVPETHHQWHGQLLY